MKPSPLNDIERLLEQGKLHEARSACLRACKKQPTHFEAWSLLGRIHAQLGDPGEAEKCFSRVVALRPDMAESHFNLGRIQSQLQRGEEAERSYERALRIAPGFVQAYNNLGNLQAARGALAEAEQNLRKALDLRADYAVAQRNLGSILRRQGRLEEAVQALLRTVELQPAYTDALEELADVLIQLQRPVEAEEYQRRALAARPGSPDGWCRLAGLLYQRGRPDEAAACYREALRQRPDDIAAHINLGSCLKDTGALPAALESCRRALALDPEHAEAHNNMGIALCEMGAFAEAVESFRRALRARPDLVEAYNNLGNALERLGQLEAADAVLQQALDRRPDDAQVHANRGNVLRLQGRLAEAVVSYRRAMELAPENARVHGSLLGCLNYSADCTREELFAEHARWGTLQAQRAQRFDTHENMPDPDRRLRIGYVSPDFRGHSVAFFIEPLLAQHHSGEVEIHCYSDVGHADEVTARLRGLVQRWRHCRGMGDAELAAQIRRDGIDILVDLAGHLEGNRLTLFAMQPAPLQVSYLGYPSTTGLRSVQHLITDGVCDPPQEADRYYTERLHRMPDAFFCYRPPAEDVAVSRLPALRDGAVTFGSFNNLAKITPQVIALWARILDAVPKSRLRVQCLSLHDAQTRVRVAAAFAAQGVDLNRLELLGSRGFADYLAAHHEVDVVLDTFPWNGHTVTCHALWMGVPVVTLAGDRHASRMGASTLLNLGCGELIAHSADACVEIAANLAGDLERLGRLRAELRARLLDSPLCDTAAFARHMEVAYRDMWRTWCHGK